MEYIILVSLFLVIGLIITIKSFQQRTKDVCELYGLTKGMEYESVVAILGEPSKKRQGRKRMTCIFQNKEGFARICIQFKDNKVIAVV